MNFLYMIKDIAVLSNYSEILVVNLFEEMRTQTGRKMQFIASCEINDEFNILSLTHSLFNKIC